MFVANDIASCFQFMLVDFRSLLGETCVPDFQETGSDLGKVYQSSVTSETLYVRKVCVVD